MERNSAGGKRRVETVFLNDREITVRELTVGQVLDLIQGDPDGGADLALFGAKAEQLLKASCGLALEDLKAFAPSQLEALYETFKTVNAAFFALARTLRADEVIDQVAAELRRSLMTDFSALLSGSSKPATKTSGPMESWV